MFLGTTFTRRLWNTFQMEDLMAEQLKTAVSQSGKTYGLTGNTKRTSPRNHSKDREAREAWLKRAELRPVQITAPTKDHVVGWDWPKVDETTITNLENILDEDED
jgi:hypothetical protein